LAQNFRILPLFFCLNTPGACVDDSKHIIIPTRYKAKISHELSFPIGAEKISKALAGVPQFGELILHFNSDRWRSIPHKRYACISVMRSSRRESMAEKYVDAGLDTLWGEWEIDVSPVPRIHRHRIQQYIVDHALSEMREWLNKRADTRLLSEETLRYFFDEERDEFAFEANEEFHPQRS
jgi:hypothetical protein